MASKNPDITHINGNQGENILIVGDIPQTKEVG